MTVSIVNTWQSIPLGTYTYGSTQLPIANSDGNWLFAIAQWENTDDLSVIYCTDDAHNFWQPVICTTITTASVRTAILVVQNASPANTVFFSSTGFIRNPIFTVIEVSGLQAGYFLDATANFATTSSSSILLNATLTQNDFVLASGVQDTTSNITNISGGWTPFGAAFNTTLQGRCAWQTGGPGSTSITFSNSGGTNSSWASVMVAVRADTPLPVNSNPNYPVIQCQAAFGNQPGDGSVYPSWTDITPRFLGLRASRGRQFELDQLESADVTITLDNPDGALNPLNTSSPYYPNVLLMTPIRVLATWQGQIFQVFSGHIEYIPQTFDFERGLVELECSDSFAKLPQVLLQSAMQQEILYDKPWGYWPLNDGQGAQFGSNHSERSARTLDPTNRFGGLTNSFGNTVSPSFKGAQDTCWSVTSNGFPSSVTTLRDHSPNGGIPSISGGVTIECWNQLPVYSATMTNTTVIMALEGNTPSTQGVIAALGINGLNAASSNLQLSYFNSSGNLVNVTVLSQNMFDGQWHHYAVQLTTTTYAVWVDGVQKASGSLTLVRSDPKIFEIAGLTSPFGALASLLPANGLTASWAHVAYYDKLIDPERIASHFASGNGGFVNDFMGNRIMRLLTYTRWTKAQAIDGGSTAAQRLDYLGQNGYGTTAIRGASGLFGSYGTSAQAGSQADLAIVDVAASENGLLLVDRNGSLVFRSRNKLYDPVLRGTFGDSFVPLNVNPYFAGGSLSPWTAANGATISSGSLVWTYCGIGSAQFHGDGVTANPKIRSESTIPVTANQSYTMNAWVYSPQGWATTQVIINWLTSGGSFISSSSSASTNVNPATPTQMSVTGTAPGTAAFAQIFVQMTGTPASSVVMVADRLPLSLAGYQVPYLGDIQIDYDMTYLYNDVNITRNVDQIMVRAVDQGSQKQYLQRTYFRTIYSAGGFPPSEVSHTAEWLLKAYSQPSPRISQMTVDAASNPDAWPFALGLDVGDTVSFVRDPIGAPAIVQNFMVIGVEPDLGPDLGSVVYRLAPILVPVLTLDNAIFGTLGNNSLGW